MSPATSPRRADALGIGSFAAWGVSGGGPHALACAAMLPDRVVAAVVVAGIAPFDLPGLDFTAGMGEASQVEFALAPQGSAVYGRTCVTPLRPSSPGKPDTADESRSCSPARPRAHAEPAATTSTWRRASGRRSAAASTAGWTTAWPPSRMGVRPGLDPAPVLLLQGGRDLMVPPAHGEWLGRHVPGADVHFPDEDGHLTVGENHRGEVLDWLRPL